jgi:hypothetical protein
MDVAQDQVMQLKQSLQESVEECVRCQEQVHVSESHGHC